MLTGSQIRMARAALSWSVRDLAGRSEVSVSTINRAEANNDVPSTTRANLQLLRTTFEAAGIEFVGTVSDAPGVRLRV
jgi:transcriptional regulator with XRE-family HTH domain